MSNVIAHNIDNAGDPKKWHCEFCGNKLVQIINKICCSSSGRKRREANEMEFWHGVTYQQHNLEMSEARDDLSKEEQKRLHMNHQQLKQEKGVLSPHEDAKRRAHEDCVDDITHKAGGVRAKELPIHPQLRKAQQAGGLLGAATRSRMKRNMERIPENQNDDGTYPAKWHYSQNNGGKGRSTYDELMTEYGVEAMECHPEIAAEFLATRSLGGNFNGKTPNRKHWKHTYLQHECCGMGDINTRQATCEFEEIKQMAIHEECCGEGCRIEEIHESCDSWRWDMFEDWEETRKTQDWRPPSPFSVGGAPIGAFAKNDGWGAKPFANAGKDDIKK